MIMNNNDRLGLYEQLIALGPVNNDNEEEIKTIHEQLNSTDVQELAERLVSLDRGDISNESEIQSLELQITDYEYSYVKKDRFGKAIFPYLGVNNRNIPIDDFFSILHDVLLKLFHNYDPKKAKFVTAFSQGINLGAINYFNRDIRRRGEKEESIEVKIEKEGDSAGLGKSYTPPDFDTEHLELDPKIAVFVRLAPIVEEQRKMDEKRNKSKRLWFESFYTFDLTKLVKLDDFCAHESLKVNGYIFIILKTETALLEFLLKDKSRDDFFHMRDVIECPVACSNILQTTYEGTIPLCLDADVDITCSVCTKLLSKRNKVLQRYLDVTSPTVIKRNDKYFEKFKEAVYSAEIFHK